jgi:hypothetical protein
MAREKWPDPKQDVLALIYREQNGQALSRVDLTLIYWEQNGQTLSRVVLAPIYREQHGQTLSRMFLAPIYSTGSRMARPSAE